MALRAVPDHPKFADLKARLGVPKHVALGILEALWHFAGRYTPQGNVGKYTDSAIEAWIEWGGAETGTLIQALVDSKWLDRDSEWRLLVHDWETHADKATKQSLNRAKLAFCVPTVHTPVAHSSVLSSLPVPVPEPVPEPEPVPDYGTQFQKSEELRKTLAAQAIARDLKHLVAHTITLPELEHCWERHHKHGKLQTLDMASQTIISMGERFSAPRLRENHPRYCDYWDRRGWEYSTLSFIGWLQAGMPDAPPEAQPRAMETVRESKTQEALRLMTERAAKALSKGKIQ